MSVDMYVASSQRQASSVATICQQQKQGYELLEQSINDFVLHSPSLEGAAYESAKDFFHAVLIPLSKGGILLSEAVVEACQAFPNEYLAKVDSEELKESDLREKIEQLTYFMADLSDLQERLQLLLYRQQQEDLFHDSIASRMTSSHSLMASYGQIREKLQSKLADLLAFDARSPAIFSEIEELERAVARGVELAGGSWDVSLGTFNKPAHNTLIWRNRIDESWRIREAKRQSLVGGVHKDG